MPRTASGPHTRGCRGRTAAPRDATGQVRAPGARRRSPAGGTLGSRGPRAEGTLRPGGARTPVANLPRTRPPGGPPSAAPSCAVTHARRGHRKRGHRRRRLCPPPARAAASPARPPARPGVPGMAPPRPPARALPGQPSRDAAAGYPPRRRPSMSKSRWVTGRGEGAGAAIVPPSPPGGGGEEARAPAGRRLRPAHARSGPRRAPLGAVRMPGLGACPRSRPEPIPRTRARSLSPPPPCPESAQAALRTRGRGLLEARARPEAARARASRACPDTRPGPRTRTRAPGIAGTSRARARLGCCSRWKRRRRRPAAGAFGTRWPAAAPAPSSPVHGPGCSVQGPRGAGLPVSGRMHGVNLQRA